MLIVALGILALLSILAITFVKLMNLEQRATTNYVDMVKARLIAEGGLERTMAQLKMSISAESYSDPNAPWIYAKGDYTLPLEEASSDQASDKRASFSGLLGVSYANGRDQYKTKVVDTQTQFNLNQKFELLDVGTEKLDLGYIRWLDALGVAISKINPRARGGTSGGRNPILNARWPPNDPNAARGGKAIYLFRQSRENEELKSKSELMEVLASEDDYNLVKDYLTTKSWFDPETVSPRAADRLHTKPWSDVIRREKRSPININLASEEVIAANLAGFAGRAIYTWMGNITTQGVDVNSTNWSFGTKQEETGYSIQGVIVYFDPFGYQDGQRVNDPPYVHGALTLARAIKTHIQNTGPFQSYADWEAFVDRTLTEGFIDNTRDPDNGNARVFPYYNTAKMTDLRGRPLANPSPNVIRGEPRFKHWFHDAVRSMLKANFNPNARLSSWNPDPAVYLPLDKGGLLWRNPDLTDDTDPNKHLHMRQTLEWCLAPKGVFEVTSLGEVLGPPPKDPRRQQDLDGDGNPDDEIFAQAKVRGILQLFDTAVIRTQRDFETKGDVYEDGSADRDEMISWPVAKIYWDPRVYGTSQIQQFYNDWVSADLMPTDESGHLSLSTRRKVGDIFHTQIVPMGLNAPNVAPEFEALFQDRRVEVPGSSRITFPDPLQADTANGKENNPNPGKPVVGRATDSNGNLNPWAWPYGDARQGIFPTARPSDLQEAWRWNVLQPDGYLNSALRPSLLWYRASDSFREPNGGGVRETMAAAGGPELDPNRRGNSNVEIKDGANVNSTDPLKQGNVAPTPVGAVEFWYKPDFDWVYRRTVAGVSSPIAGGGTSGATAVDQRFCGLLGTSHILWNQRGYTHSGATSQGVFSRGTQMYITRNTSGEVRITRLYFEVCGREGSAFEVPYVNDPVNGQKIKLSDYYQKVRTDQQYFWPPQELLLDIPQEFQDIRWARTDYWLPATVFQSWRRGEWHHLALRWEDRSDLTPVPGKRASLQVWIDGQGPVLPVVHHIGSQAGTPGYPGYIPVGSYDQNGTPVPPPPPAPQQLPLFVRLNAQSYNPSQGEAAERPKDMITLGSVWRDQMRKDDGIFKHTDDGRVNLPANGTIDDVRFYDGSTVISDPTPNIEYNGRYVQQGLWTGEIDLSKYFPSDSGALTLGALNFVAYLPTTYGATNGAHISRPQGAGTVTVTFDVRDPAGNSKVSAATRALWTTTFQSNTAAPNSKSGFPLKDERGTPIVVGRNDRLVYTVQMTSAKYDRATGLNNTTGASVHSPALDELSVIYFLPASRVLLKERVNN